MIPHHQPPPGPRTLLSAERSEIAAALRGHGLEEWTVTEILDFAELEGDVQTARARVTFDGESWTADLFGPGRDAA